MRADERYVAKELSSGEWIVYDQEEKQTIARYARASGYRAELEARARNEGRSDLYE